MPITAIPVLSLRRGDRNIASRLGESFRSFGFAVIADHGIDPGLIGSDWELSESFFAQTDNEKRRYHVPDLAGARGYTPFGIETAKGASTHDLKEFWHIGRDLARTHPLAASMPANIWPDDPSGFREIFSALFAEFDRVGSAIMALIAIDLGLDPAWFEPALKDGNSVLRLLHYPPVPGDPGSALRAGPHEDINLITLLLGAQEAGLELLCGNGDWLAVSPPEGALVVNIGDMLQRLTNHMLPSTTHRVRNPASERSGHSRYAMPFFLHLRSDFRIETLPQCVSEAKPDRYASAITADQFLQERLREIGLRD